MREYWDKKHTDNDKWYLTGTSLAKYISIFGIPAKRFGTVVEIGVGLGYATKGLSDKCEKVYAVDISEVALDRVKDFTTPIRSDRMSEIPSNCADIVVCHLVAQHNLDVTLETLISEAIRVLRPKDGTFYLQFADSMQDKDEREALSDEKKMQEGFMFRSLETVDRMVRDCGGRITTTMRQNFSKYSILWHIVHIRKDK